MTVSFETAKALKEAGFPQSQQWGFGMVWYIPDDEEEYMREDDPSALMYGDEAVFAPTATDLLPVGWLLLRRTEDWVAISAANLINSVGQEYIEPYFRHPNPHEAAAQARLFVNRKNDQK